MGYAPRIQPLETHNLRQAEHTSFALSAEFRQLEQVRPQMAQALVMHAEGHRALMEDGEGAKKMKE